MPADESRAARQQSRPRLHCGANCIDSARPARQHSPNSWRDLRNSGGLPSPRSPSASSRRCPPRLSRRLRLRLRSSTYRIEVSLDPEAKMLKGTEQLTWRNPSRGHGLRAPLPHVPERLQEPALDVHAGVRRPAPRRQGAGQARGLGLDRRVLDPRRRRGAPARRAIRPARRQRSGGSDRPGSVPLPSPVPPRGEITLEIAFDAKLPKIFARTGCVRDYFLVGQWYPKLGVYEPAGMRGRTAGGWNCHAFHGNSEFYADFGQLRRDDDRARRGSSSARPASASPKRRPATRPRYRYVAGRTSTTSPGRPTRGSSGHGLHLRSRPATCRRAGRPAPRRSSGCARPDSP